MRSPRRPPESGSSPASPDSVGAGLKLLHLLPLAIAAALILGSLSVVPALYQSPVGQILRPARQVSLQEPPPEPLKPSDDQHPPLRVAVAPVIAPEKSHETYKELARYVAGRLGMSATILQRASYAETNELLRHRRCDLAFVCTYAFVRGQKEFGMEVLAVPVVRGALTYKSFIIVPRDSGAESLLDLRGQRFASADLLSTTGWLYPATWLLRRGEDPDRFFSDHLTTGSHDRAILAVESGYAAGAAVDSLVYDEAQRDSGERSTRKILESPPFGMPPIAVHPQLDPTLKTRLRRTLLEMASETEGKRILSAIAIDRFVVPKEDLYAGVRRAAREWETRP